MKQRHKKIVVMKMQVRKVAATVKVKTTKGSITLIMTIMITMMKMEEPHQDHQEQEELEATTMPTSK